jgi:hypothetical protein
MPEQLPIRVEDVTVMRTYRVVYEGDNEVANELVQDHVHTHVDITNDPSKQFLVALAANNAARRLENVAQLHKRATLSGRFAGAVVLGLSTIESTTPESPIDNVSFAIIGAGFLLLNEKRRVDRQRNDTTGALRKESLITSLQTFGSTKMALEQRLNPEKYHEPAVQEPTAAPEPKVARRLWRRSGKER